MLNKDENNFGIVYLQSTLKSDTEIKVELVVYNGV